MDIKNVIHNKKLFIFDVDGTISLSSKPFPYTSSVFNFLNGLGIKACIFTNNSSKTPEQYRKNLAGIGISHNVDILTSLDVALDYLLNEKKTNIYWSANRHVSEYIAARGFTYDNFDPCCVLMTYDTELNYDKLLDIVKHIHSGAPFFVTHADIVCPTDMGYPVPDVGSFIELIKSSTGKIPDKSFGKPEPLGILSYISSLGLTPEDAIMFGDRLYTDIQFGINAGITTALVLSGETTLEMYEKSTVRADFIIENIGALV